MIKSEKIFGFECLVILFSDADHTMEIIDNLQLVCVCCSPSPFLSPRGVLAWSLHQLHPLQCGSLRCAKKEDKMIKT